MQTNTNQDVQSRKDNLLAELGVRVVNVINAYITRKYPRYSDYLDVEATANSSVAPAAWKAEAQIIAEWVYGIFQALEAKEAEIMAMGEEELNSFDMFAYINSLPEIPQI